MRALDRRPRRRPLNDVRRHAGHPAQDRPPARPADNHRPAPQPKAAHPGTRRGRPGRAALGGRPARAHRRLPPRRLLARPVVTPPRPQDAAPAPRTPGDHHGHRVHRHSRHPGDRRDRHGRRPRIRQRRARWPQARQPRPPRAGTAGAATAVAGTAVAGAGTAVAGTAGTAPAPVTGSPWPWRTRWCPRDPAPADSLPTTSHWARTARARRGRHPRRRAAPEDPSPSPLLGNVDGALRHPTRVRRPAVRRGWLEGGPGTGDRRGQEPFVEVGWGEALDLVAAELARVRAEHGPAPSSAAPTAGRRPGASTTRRANCTASSPVRRLHRLPQLLQRRRLLVLLPHLVGRRGTGQVLGPPPVGPRSPNTPS
ncbi:hypothetical protein NKH77_54200 [Streptomyces sp. M19]